ncbi:hypothetical protein [Mycobacterium talmoniae]|uniref:Acid stress chaperone HdeA n=1 Tax=Mycobacterium talmoniae TaxID=1858794 RepID=A0A1S1MHQ0_9MYCO|nr:MULTISPECIES: hypothetical protein [Mycobacterium]OHU83181.1 hypothetical protein BKN37_26785 [Mycobacterium talmoniae]PQM45739.1 hypothetical protein C1Y40_04095 [Mycobacterium talmoniae]TDH52473.1 hypothetical protein E2F47_14270 [Mycobacterium eburneum]
MRRFGIGVVSIVAAAVCTLTGCSAVDKVTNKGGDTTCKEFRRQSQDKQESEVTKMLKDQHGKEPSHLEVSATRVAVDAYCQTIGKDSSKISDSQL